MPKSKAKQDEIKPRSPAYYWWFLANVSALCFAIHCWIFCLNIFGHPEIPRNYQILDKIGRLPELQKFTSSTLPKGKAYAPADLYKIFSELRDEDLEKFNAQLLKNYLQNFSQKHLLTFIEGSYQVLDAKRFSQPYFFPSGFAIRAQALVNSDSFSEPTVFPVIIDCIFPSQNTSVWKEFQKGDGLEISKNPHAYAVIKVSRIDLNQEPALLLTITPIVYQSQKLAKAQSFSINPPERLNLRAGLRVWE